MGQKTRRPRGRAFRLRGALQTRHPQRAVAGKFSDDDILVGNKEGTEIGFVQVKACHPDRSASFILRATHEAWQEARIGHLCVFVWLGGTKSNEAPNYWIAEKRDVGRACVAHPAHGTGNWERRFYRKDLSHEWENRWSLFDRFRPLPPV